MSFFPTSAEMRAAIRWLKRHPFVGAGVAVAVVGAAAYYLLGGEDGDESPQLSGLQPPPVVAIPAPTVAQSPPRSDKTLGGLPSRRSVVWSDDNGGELSSVFGSASGAAPVVSAGPSGISSNVNSMVPPVGVASGPSYAAVIALASKDGDASPGGTVSARSSVSFPSGGDISGVPNVTPTVHTVADASGLNTLRPLVHGRLTSSVASPSPALKAVGSDTAPAVRCDSPLDTLRAAGFSGTCASGVGVLPDTVPAPVGTGAAAAAKVVITCGVVSPEKHEEGDWGHFLTPDTAAPDADVTPRAVAVPPLPQLAQGNASRGGGQRKRRGNGRNGHN